MCPLWFTLLGGSFVFLGVVLPFCSLYSPLFGCFGLYLIGRVSSQNHFVPLMDPRVESCSGFQFGFSSILPHLLLSLESCFPPLNIAPPRSFAHETPEVGQTLTSTYKHTMQDVCMGTRLHSYNLVPIHTLHSL
jgi:hypothetical protein